MSILLLQFDGAEAAALTEILHEHGFAVLVSSNASEGLTAPSPDTIVMADGDLRSVEICRTLRKAGYFGAILVIGDRRSTAAGAAALDAGADDFVVRPVDAHDLVARVRAVLRRVVAHSMGQWGPLSVDRVTHVVYLRGVPLRLTVGEYAVLACLVEAQGEVVTRAAVLARLGGSRRTTRSNLVEVYLSRVRDKFGPDAQMIETVRRGGYNRLRQ